MRIAYLILAHKNAGQLADLVHELSDGASTRCFIHIDKRSEAMLASPELHALKNKPNVQFVSDRVRVHWGGFSMVEATLRLLCMSVQEAEFDYAVLLSGQCFPIKSKSAICSFFEANFPTEFVTHIAWPSDDWSADISERLEYYWVVDRIRALLERLFASRNQRRGWSLYYQTNRAIHKSLPWLRKRLPNGLVPYGGSQWFAITYSCARYLVDYVRNQPGYCDFFRLSLVPDEHFFQTLVLNSPFRERVQNDNLRFVDWKSGPEYPRVLTADDFQRLILANALFARKLDAMKCPDVIRQLKEHNRMPDR